MPSPSPRLFVVALPEQETIVADAVAEAGLDLVAVGSTTHDHAVALARRFDADRIDDLRQGALRDDVEVLWIAAPMAIDAETLRLIAERGIDAITSEPIPADVTDLARDAASSTSTASPAFAPLFRRSPGFVKARTVLDDFGPVECVNVAMLGPPEAGSLFARLFDAVDTIDALCGGAERVDATLGGAESVVPESLATLRGHLTLNLRFAERVGACASVSNRANAWRRTATIVGPAGVLVIDDRACRWSAEDVGLFGEGGGRGGDEGSGGGRDHAPTPGALVGMQVRRMRDRLDAAAEPPPPTTRLLALCEAARLSCRTRQVETPQRILEMLRRP